MKKNLIRLVLMVIFTIFVNYSQAQIQDKDTVLSVCITDGYGYVWTFPKLHSYGSHYDAKGTVVVTGSVWTAYISGNKKRSAGKPVVFRAINRHPDCALNTDSFTYNGTATAKLVAGHFDFSGSGGWTSYCDGGGVVGTGAWSATDCAAKSGIIINSNNNPAAPKVVNTLKISPNPVVNSANISYTLSSPGKVVVTVYNSMQQPLEVLVNDFKLAGNYTVIWDTKRKLINPGLYRVVALVSGQTYTTTVMVVR